MNQINIKINWNNKEDSWNDNDKNKKEEENWFKIENIWNDRDDNGWNNVFNESKTNIMNLNHKRKRSNDNFS